MKNRDFRSQFMEQFITSLSGAMQSIADILEGHGIEYCFIGGAAVIKQGYERMTGDVDLLIAIRDRRAWELDLRPYYHVDRAKNPKGVVWNSPEMAVDVIFSGRLAGEGFGAKRGLVWGDPIELSETRDGFPFLTLDNLIQYKLSTGLYVHNRGLQDFADVQGLIQGRHLEFSFGNQFRSDLRAKFQRLWKEIKWSRQSLMITATESAVDMGL